MRDSNAVMVIKAQNIIFDTVFKTVFHATKLIFDHMMQARCIQTQR